MRAPERRQEEAALERLSEHETALTRRLETARAEAEQVRIAAAAEAAALLRLGRERLEQEVASAALAEAGALDEELEVMRKEASRAVEAVRERAARWREEAVSRAIEAASGGPP